MLDNKDDARSSRDMLLHVFGKAETQSRGCEVVYVEHREKIKMFLHRF